MIPPNKPSELLSRVESSPAKTPAELGYAAIQLPSRGRLYGDRLPDGLVHMRKMRAGEQAKLNQQGGTVMERIEAVVNACTKFPEGFRIKELLLTDSFFLMLALRSMTFGTKYSYTYRCKYCTSVEKASVDIQADLEEKIAPDDLTEPQQLELPDAQCSVGFRFLRVEDQDLVVRYAKRTKLGSADRNDPSYLYRLALCLVERNGTPFSDLMRRQDFVMTLTAADVVRLDRALDDREPGVDTHVYPSCTSCNATNEMGLPFDGEFFRPTDV